MLLNLRIEKILRTIELLGMPFKTNDGVHMRASEYLSRLKLIRSKRID